MTKRVVRDVDVVARRQHHASPAAIPIAQEIVRRIGGAPAAAASG